MVGIEIDGAVPSEPSIQMVGSIATVSGMVDVLYDGPNQFIGLRDEGGNFMIFNMEETTRIIDLLREAQELTGG